MSEVYTAYSTTGAQELLEKGYRVRRHSWGKMRYLIKRHNRYFSVDENQDTEFNITDCLELVWQLALDDNKGDIDWVIC